MVGVVTVCGVGIIAACGVRVLCALVHFYCVVVACSAMLVVLWFYCVGSSLVC